jgi:predicted transcriptional regulator of viral defense system
MVMSVNNLEKVGLIKRPQIEQAMAWLIEHGPLVEKPQLPAWMLKQLVRENRIARLRRGLYLVPDKAGRMLPVAVVAALLAPLGYVSFYGALTLHGLTDQDASVWAVVTDKFQGDVRYGPFTLQFAVWPRRLRRAKTKKMAVDGVQIRVATPAQALSDALEAPRFGAALPELLHVLRVGLSTRRVTVAQLRQRAVELGSVTLARRLGLLLELATGDVDPVLATLARRSHRWTEGNGRQVRDSQWRLVLPTSRKRILTAARE